MMNSGTAYIIGMIVCAVLSYLIGSVNFTAIFAKKYDAFPDTMGIYKKPARELRSELPRLTV